MAMHRLLAHSRPLPGAAVLEPLTFERCAKVVEHCRRSAPGPDGIPYAAWACSGEAGTLVL